MGLSIRRQANKRLPARAQQQQIQPEAPSRVWSPDFMHDCLWDGRTYRMLIVIHNYNRAVLAIETGTSPPSTPVLEQLKDIRGHPDVIPVENAPELISHYRFDVSA